MRYLLVLCAALALVATANANLLINGDIESSSGEQFDPIDDWGPNGAWAPHAGFTPPGGGYVPELGDKFGFYSAGGPEIVGQIVDTNFAPSSSYQFSGWFTGGGNGEGEVVLQIGYDDGGTFALLDTLAITTTNAWAGYDGLTYTTADSGPELGMPIWVRLGDGVDGEPGFSDIWFDNLYLTPEPTSLLLLGVAALLLRRR